MSHCQHCGAQTSNGLELCELCQRLAATIFEMLPVYFRNLSRQRRAGRPNGTLGISGQWIIQRGETEGSKIAAALERVGNDLDTWSRAVTGDVTPRAEATEPETVTALCDFLEANITSIATQDWAGQFIREMARHEKALRHLTENAVPGWYAGKCRQVTGRDMEGNTYTCGADTHVIPGLTWVTCASCGTTTYARDHLPVIVNEARTWVAPPMRIAEAVVALMDTELSVPRLHKRISKWGERGQIEVLRRTDEDGDPIGPKRFKLGDALDMLHSEGPTRLEKCSAGVLTASGCEE